MADIPQTYSSRWHVIGPNTWAMTVHGGALVRVDANGGTTMTFVPGASVAHRWQRREPTVDDPSRVFVETALVETESEVIHMDGCVPMLFDSWVCADDGLPELPAELRGPGTPSGTTLIAAERRRQLEQWSPEHDREHRFGELAIRAAELAVDGTDEVVSDHRGEYDCWGLVIRSRGDRIRQLVIAGALIAAEIDRLAAESEP